MDNFRFYEIVLSKRNLVFMFSLSFILLSALEHRSHVHVQKDN